MKNLAILSAIVIIVSVFAFSCGEDGKSGADGRTVLTQLSDESPGENCENGGTKVETGFDENGDGELVEDEILETTYICDGEDGVDGDDGTDGRPGADGKDGADGEDGVDGEKGEQGDPGTDGTDGEDGTDGTDGTDGEDSVCFDNTAPVINSVTIGGEVFSGSSIDVEKGEQVSVIIDVTDTEDDSLTYNISGGSAEIADNSNGSFTFTFGDTGEFHFSVIVSDGCNITIEKFSIISTVTGLAGGVVINEINPENGWIELYNRNENGVYLENLNIRTKSDLKLFSGFIPENGFFMIYDVTINSDEDEVIFETSFSTVDSVAWSENISAGKSIGRFPNASEEVMVLDVPTENSENKIDIGWCGTQHPESFESTKGAPTDPIFGQIYSENVTDTYDLSINMISAQLCYTSDLTDLTSPVCEDSAWHKKDNDNHEYYKQITIETAGEYKYYYRFSGDGGTSWVDCNLTSEGGSNSDLSADKVGDMTINENPEGLRIFMSNWSGSGDFGGVEGADTICNSDENRPDTEQKYKALIGVSGTRDLDNDWPLQKNMNYYRDNGDTLIGSTDAQGRLQFSLDNSISFYNNEIWTGMVGGYFGMASSCGGWTTTSGTGSVGHAHKVDNDVIYAYPQNCNRTNVRLYCVEQPPLSEWHKVESENPLTKRYLSASVVFQDKIWVIGGNNADSEKGYDYNDVWYSEDGMNWTRAVEDAPFEKRHGHQAFVYDDKIWVLGGRSQNDGDWATYPIHKDVWYSENGTDWVLATDDAAFGPVFQSAAGVYDGKMWVIGATDPGNSNVHSSTDGITWTLETDSPAFGSRGSARILDYDGKMWLIGGYPSKSDDWVYYTEDGINWTKVDHETNIYTPETFSHDAIVYKSEMWFFGGHDTNWYSDIIYHSKDGVSWEKVTGENLFTPRSGATVEIFNDKVWIIGGRDGSGILDDVVYYSE
ncbi:MAG: DUF1554 domain-containing protein [bacterium]